MYLALYRKYRPQNFDEVIGQDKIIQTLKNQIKSGKIGHAYLFCGSRGTGKTSTAKIFARAINCTNPKDGSACGNCEVCKALSGENVDIVEIDAASNNGVDQIRDLKEQVKYPPINGQYKVYIIDEVHMLSVNAFNALLKTLEEPPKFVVFILATTEVHKLPQTILSRCMRFDFDLVSLDELKNLLKRICDENKITYDDLSLNLIARAGEGSVRDMLSAADRCIAFCGDKLNSDEVVKVLGVASREVLFDISENILSGDMGKTLTSIDDALSSGKSPLVLSKDLISYFRDLLFCLTVPEKAQNYVVVSNDFLNKMKEQASSERYEKILSAIYNLSEVEAELRYSISPRIVLETAIIKTLSGQSLNDRVAKLEKNAQNVTKSTQQTVENIQKPQNIVKEVEKTVEKVAESSKTQTKSGILGELIEYLNKNCAFSLVAALDQVKSIEVKDNVANIIFDDEVTIGMIKDGRNKAYLDKFFTEKGLTYKLVLAR